MRFRSYVLNPALITIALAVAIGCYFWPGGFDALNFFLTKPTNSSIQPAWVYLITLPIGLLPWPFGWLVIVFLDIMSAGVLAQVVGVKRWYLVLLSFPMLNSIWLGQIEFLSILGILIGWGVVQKRLHPAWLGLAWIFLVSKPHEGAGLILLFTWWVLREQGWKACLVALIPALGIFVLTLILWPGWVFNWPTGIKLAYGDSPLWPYGLLAWIPALLAPRADKLVKMRLFAAATILGSPYFHLYHVVPLFAMVGDPLLIVFSFLPLAMLLGLGGDTWLQWIWLVPAAVLAVDLYREYYRMGRADLKPVAG